jgi:uncharacterized protein (TIGR02271 family)
MTTPFNKEEVTNLRGSTVLDSEGGKVGTVEEIYLDRETDQPEWALVSTGWFAGKSSFVPLAEARLEGSELVVPYDQQTVKGAPTMDADAELSQSEEAELYNHYGLDYSEAPSDSGLPTGTTGDTETVGRDTSGPETDDAMTRSEEELRVGKTQSERGRVRLKKYVVTENVTETVPVRREEARIEREPITDSNVDEATEGPAISEEEHEVVLHEEEPVVEKRAVPKERVRLAKDATTEEHEVSEELRKEQVEEEGDISSR